MLWDTLNTLFNSNCGYVGIFRFAFDFRSVVLVFADKHFSLGGELMPVATLTLTGCTLEHLYIRHLITYYDYTLIIYNECRLSVRGAHSVTFPFSGYRESCTLSRATLAWSTLGPASRTLRESNRERLQGTVNWTLGG